MDEREPWVGPGSIWYIVGLAVVGALAAVPAPDWSLSVDTVVGRVVYVLSLFVLAGLAIVVSLREEKRREWRAQRDRLADEQKAAKRHQVELDHVTAEHVASDAATREYVTALQQLVKDEMRLTNAKVDALSLAQRVPELQPLVRVIQERSGYALSDFETYRHALVRGFEGQVEPFVGGSLALPPAPSSNVTQSLEEFVANPPKTPLEVEHTIVKIQSGASGTGAVNPPQVYIRNHTDVSSNNQQTLRPPQ